MSDLTIKKDGHVYEINLTEFGFGEYPHYYTTTKDGEFFTEGAGAQSKDMAIAEAKYDIELDEAE